MPHAEDTVTAMTTSDSGSFGTAASLRDNTFAGMGVGALAGLLLEGFRRPERRDYLRAALLSSLLGGMAGNFATQRGYIDGSVVDKAKGALIPAVNKGRRIVSDAAKSVSDWMKPANDRSRGAVDAFLKSAAANVSDDDARLLVLRRMYPELDQQQLGDVNSIFGKIAKVDGSDDTEKFIKRRILANVMLNSAIGGLAGGAVGRIGGAIKGKDKAKSTAAGAAAGMLVGGGLSYLKSKLREKLGLDPMLQTIGTARV